MDELLARISEAVTGRIDGPMAFRLVLQPAVATYLAVRAGLHDARSGQPYYAWAIFTDPVHRRELLREGWKAVAKIFVLAVLIDPGVPADGGAYGASSRGAIRRISPGVRAVLARPRSGQSPDANAYTSRNRRKSRRREADRGSQHMVSPACFVGDGLSHTAFWGENARTSTVRRWPSFCLRRRQS